MKDYLSRPKRMGKEAMVVIFSRALYKSVKGSILLWLLIAGASMKKGNFNVWILVALVAYSFVMPIVSTLITYFYTTYHVEGSQLVFNHGWLHPKTQNIPLDRIHALRTKQGVIYQLLDMVGIEVDTTAKEGEELSLVLTKADWERLKAYVEEVYEGKKGDEKEDGICAVERSQEVHAEGGRVFGMSLNDKLKAAMAQNFFGKSFVLVFSTIYYLFSKLDRWVEGYINDHWNDMKEGIKGISTSTFTDHLLLIVGITLVVYILAFVVWTAWLMLKYYRLTLQLTPESLYYEAGGWNRLSATFLKDKVVALEVKQNFLERWLGTSTLTLRQAKNVAGKGQKNEVKIYGFPYTQEVQDWFYAPTQERKENVSGERENLKGMAMELKTVEDGLKGEKGEKKGVEDGLEGKEDGLGGEKGEKKGEEDELKGEKGEKKGVEDGLEGEEDGLGGETISVFSGKGVFWRSLFSRTLVLSIITCVTLIIVWEAAPITFIPVGVLLTVVVTEAVLTQRHSYIRLQLPYIHIGKGRWAEITDAINIHGIEAMQLRKTLTYKWSHRTHLFIYTKGPTFALRSLKEDEAQMVYNLLLEKGA